jgi:hypothetical protein
MWDRPRESGEHSAACYDVEAGLNVGISPARVGQTGVSPARAGACDEVRALAVGGGISPAHAEVDGDADTWTLSVLCVIAQHVRPAGSGRVALVPKLIIEALGTESWYRTLPLLGRTDPDASQTVVEVLHRHCQVAGRQQSTG